MLHELAYADWHTRHEDIALTFEDMKWPDSVPALIHLANWVPDYLAWDERRALARKAVWGLGVIGTDEAVAALKALADSDSTVVAGFAKSQLGRLGL